MIRLWTRRGAATASTGDAAAAPETMAVDAELTRGLFSGVQFGAVASALAAMTLVSVLWDVVDVGRLVAWLVVMLVAQAARWGIWRAYRTATPGPEAARAWRNRLTLLTFATGAGWGAVGLFLLPSEEIHLAFVGFVMAGIAAGAVSTVAGSTRAFAAFLVPQTSLFVIGLVRSGDLVHQAMAALSILFALILLLVADQLARSTRQSMTLRIRNAKLVDDLSASRDELQASCSALQHEVAERRRGQTTLHRSEERLRLHAQQAPLAFIEWDLSFRVLDWNPAAERIFGYSREQALGRTASELIASDETCAEVTALWTQTLKLKTGGAMTVNNRTRTGARIVCEWHYTPLVERSGRVASLITIAVDVTDSKRIEERLNFLAFNDPLTGLPNRAMLGERLAAAVSMGDGAASGLAVLLLDLDHFKVINETMGHELGDRLLALVGNRLVARLSEGAFVARFGGDEFGVIASFERGSSGVMASAQAILDCFQSPFMVDGREIHLGASVGIALHPHDGVDPDGLLKSADSAMNHAKAQGRNNFQFYSADLTRRSQARLDAESGLRRALERDEFVIFYQPQVELQTGAVVGVEALLRWRHPERGLVSPADFIPVAEETGLIVPIGEWVLRQACTEVATWGVLGVPPVKLSVNLSPRQFRNDRLVASVVRILGETRFDPGRLEFEITESVLMDEALRVRTSLEQFKGMGISVAIDDFGTGFSSLGYLKQFAVDALKIDRSFVRDVPVDLDDVAIVRAVIGMARSLRLRTVAEGVEQESQVLFLRAEGCEVVQGFFYGQPAESGEIARRLALRKRLADL